MEGKAVSRRQSRRKAFELLFELEQHPALSAESILERTLHDPDAAEVCATDEDQDGYVIGPFSETALRFIGELVHAAHDHQLELDSELAKYPHDWSYERIGVPERVLLRLALAEMLHLGTSFKVVINEALDLAKLYAQDEASRFINGILGAVVRNLEQLKAARSQTEQQP